MLNVYDRNHHYYYNCDPDLMSKGQRVYSVRSVRFSMCTACYIYRIIRMYMFQFELQFSLRIWIRDRMHSSHIFVIRMPMLHLPCLICLPSECTHIYMCIYNLFIVLYMLQLLILLIYGMSQGCTMWLTYMASFRLTYANMNMIKHNYHYDDIIISYDTWYRDYFEQQRPRENSSFYAQIYGHTNDLPVYILATYFVVCWLFGQTGPSVNTRKSMSRLAEGVWIPETAHINDVWSKHNI